MPVDLKNNLSEAVWTKLLTLLGEIRDITKKILEKNKEEEDYDGIVETYELTAETNVKTLWPPLDKNRKRPKWLSVQVINDSDAINIYVGINEGSACALKIKPGESEKIQFGNKRKIKFINYKAESETAPIRVICTR